MRYYQSPKVGSSVDDWEVEQLVTTSTFRVTAVIPLLIHKTTIKMTATIPNGSNTLSGVSLPKETRLGAGGKELPELYR
jgi:hypothetical protein